MATVASCIGTKPIRIIAAVARNGAIGLKGQLPWSIPEDWDFLCKSVTGCVWIVGRKCYEEVGGAFPTAASTIVLSRRQKKGSYTDATVASSLSEAISLAQKSEGDSIFIGGGVEVFREAYSIASEIFVTEIDHDFAGDVFMPTWHSYFPHCTSERKSSDANYTYSFRVYTKDTMESTSDHALV
eukprot:m.165154 g.165154  ORF g.165154 m.165154 type:complete len:184 (+) comp18126_c0_seq3:136-687(+)